MIIKKLTIKSFGKLKNKEISFDPNVNIVFGENERGKSTALAFIRAMLYGFPATRSKDIKINDRLRYLPWDGGKATGEMLIDHEGREIIISRTFGTGKREDSIEVFDALTGREIEELKDYEIGSTLLSLRGEDFDKTLNIRQLNSYIARSKEDDLLQRISNLKDSGEEGVSFDKALMELQYQRKLITNNRKSGELNLAEEELSKLYDEHRRALNISKENVQTQLKLNGLIEKRQQLKRDISNLELYKRHMKRSKLHKEYRELTEYLKKSESLKASKLMVEQELNTGEGIINEDFINGLKEEYSSSFSLYKALTDRQQQLDESNIIFREKLRALDESYQGFEDVPEDVEEKLMRLTTEINSLRFMQKQSSSIKGEIDALKEEMKAYEIGLGPFAGLLNDDKGSNPLIDSYEKKLRELKAKLEGSNEDRLRGLRKISKRKILSSSLVLIGAMLCFSIAFLFPSIAKGLKITLALAGSLSIIYFLYLSYQLMKLNASIKELSEEEKQIEELKKEIDTIEEQLKDTMDKLSIASYEDFLIGYKKFSNLCPIIEVLRIKIEDREKSLKSNDLDNVEAKLLEKEEELKELLSSTESMEPEEFLKKLKEYKKEKLECEIVKREIINQEASRNILAEEYREKEEALRRKLSSIGLGNISFESIQSELARLMERIQKLKELQGELNSIDTTYKALLKERDIESLKQELGAIEEEELKLNYKNEEEIDQALKELNLEFLNNEKEIKDKENLLDNLFKDVRPIWQLEEHMENTKSRIQELYKKVKVLDIILDNLKDSFKEIQKSFGPALNKEVGVLLGRITEERYQEVKVSEEYGLTLRDKADNKLFSGEYLSSGTFDQAYLALRLAIIKLIFNNASLPVLLDDAFIQYDDRRLESSLETLFSFSKHKQIIIFTCQSREKQILEHKENIRIINL